MNQMNMFASIEKIEKNNNSKDISQPSECDYTDNELPASPTHDSEYDSFTTDDRNSGDEVRAEAEEDAFPPLNDTHLQRDEIPTWPMTSGHDPEPVHSRTFYGNRSATRSDQQRPRSEQHKAPPRRHAHFNDTHKHGRQPHNQPVFGTGQPSALRALPRGAPRQQEQRKNPVGIFVTRLVPRTTARSIEESIQYDTGIKLRAEPLPTKYPTYRSFFLRCDGRAQSRLLDASVWPRDTLVKLYYE